VRVPGSEVQGPASGIGRQRLGQFTIVHAVVPRFAADHDGLHGALQSRHRRVVAVGALRLGQQLLDRRETGPARRHAEVPDADEHVSVGGRQLYLHVAIGGAVVGFEHAADGGVDGLDDLKRALSSPDAAVRYWALVGLGNLGQKAAASANAVARYLDDPSASVRIAAARALARMDQPGPALEVLQEELASSEEWVRLNAAIVLDEMDEQARPAIMALKKAVADRQNKYVVRVANRALNELLGTHNMVP